MRYAIVIQLIFVSVLCAESASVRQRFVLNNHMVKAEVEQIDGVWRERYYAVKALSAILVLESGSSARSDPALRIGGRPIAAAYDRAYTIPGGGGKQSIVLEGSSGAVAYRKTIALPPGSPYAEITVSMRVRGGERIGYFLSTYSFVPEGRDYRAYRPLDFIFTPQLRPDSSQVIADHTFRAPALMLQKKNIFAALVPEISSIDQRSRPLRTTADLQIETAKRPFLSFGFQNWIPEPYSLRKTHVYYAAPDSLAADVRDTTLSYGYLLFVSAAAPEREGYRMVTRVQWERYGSAAMQASHGPQDKPFSEYIKKAWYEFLPQIALDTVYGGQPVTLLRQGRLAWSNALPKAADNDCWFSVWFNALRTAYGMHLYADALGDGHLKEQAVRVLNLALSAPQQRGIAPTIFYLDSSGGHWIADHAWGGIRQGECLPMFHNAWTCYWMLQWIDLAPERRAEILRYTRAFAEFLLREQRSSGVIPSWYDPRTLEPAVELRDENAETAGAALFLAEFARREGGAEYLRASELAMQYISAGIVPERKWFDFETFFSCSRKPIGFFDPFTRQHPQNTLSMHQAAEAWLALYRLTGKKEYLAKGTGVLDYLCLYQQIWSPKWLSCELYGGFGVQNTDGEWSDSRQGYFAVTFMNYYDATGRKEYFERGVAALRAMFSLFESPSSPRTAENYAHSGVDKLAGVTGIHWGTGSSVVSIHQIAARYGEAYVDVRRRWGVGIDGCRIPAVSVKGAAIRIELIDNVGVPRLIRLKFGTLQRSSYVITVNGRTLGTTSRADLSSGIKVQI